MQLPSNSRHRIVVVDPDKCKPSKCGRECKKFCPVVRMGKQCIEVDSKSQIAWFSEQLCNGCGICVQKCPFNAVKIVNLPTSLGKNETTHRYGPNGFLLHRLPTPRRQQVLGLVGTNGIGKSTALKILMGKLKPNLGMVDNNGRPPREPTWEEILKHFKGSELQKYFTKLLNENLRAVIKVQHVDAIPVRAGKGKTVQQLLQHVLDSNTRFSTESSSSTTISSSSSTEPTKYPFDSSTMDLLRSLDVDKLLSNVLEKLSGGELQRVCIAATCLHDANIYMFDEPSSFLDVKQRLSAARAIRNMRNRREEVYVIVVEHDLSVLDFMSDFVCVLYGLPGAYGVVTLPFGVREGINIFLGGFIPTENLRFRDAALTFSCSNGDDESVVLEESGKEDFDDKKSKKKGKNEKESSESSSSRRTPLERRKRREPQYFYPDMSKTVGNFTLNVESGGFSDSEIVVMMGENGTGKTTFVRMLVNLMKEEEDEKQEAAPNTSYPSPPSTSPPSSSSFSMPNKMRVSYKPQHIVPKFDGTVEALLMKRARVAMTEPQFTTDVLKPMKILQLMDRQVQELSGGELQRVALTLCLGTPADLYLIDEPSAYLDSEQRVVASRAIKRFILHSKKAAFVVEHDFIMATYLADRIIVFGGIPSISCTAHSPTSMISGVNTFLQSLEVTFRRDSRSFRPRINKPDGRRDREQKQMGTYFFVEQ